MAVNSFVSLVLALLPRQAAPAPAAADSSADAARAQRLAEDRTALEKEIAAVDAFGHVDQLIAAARDALAGAGEGSGKKWVRMSDGALTTTCLERFVAWNSPSGERGDPVALHVQRPNHPYAVIVDLAHQLREHGIDLLFVSFPTRLQLYPELLVPLASMEGLHAISPGTLRFLLELQKEGVETLALGRTLMEHRYETRADGTRDELYLRDNQHWTPRAAELAAQAVAARVRRFSWFTPGPAQEGRDFTVAPGELLLDHRICFDGSPWESDERLPVVRVTRGKNQPVEAKDPSSPIVLLGDSFATFPVNEHCNFATHLFRALGRGVDVINPNGGVELTSRDALRRRRDGMPGKRLVIWLVSEQELRPSPDWKIVPMFEK